MGLLAAVRQLQSRVMVSLSNRLRAPLSEQRRAMHFSKRGTSHGGYSERLQMMCNMVTSLIEHERIKTTWAKAKMVARLSDRLVTKAKRGGMSNKQQAGRYVKTRSSMAKLFTLLADRYRNRRGGYTRVLRTYPRMGDQAEMAFVELVDRPLIKMPWALPEQPTSVVPGRGGRAFRAGKRDLRDEVRGGRG